MVRLKSITPKNCDEVALGALTIIVGPNNSGKSQLLRDIGLCISGKEGLSKVLQSADLNITEAPSSLFQQLLHDEKSDINGNFQITGPTGDIISRNKTQFTYRTLSEDEIVQEIKQTFAYRVIKYLTTEDRLTLTKRQTNFAPEANSGIRSLVKSVFDSSEDIEGWLSLQTQSSFNLSIVLDSYSNAGAIEFRVLPLDTCLPHDRIGKRRVLEHQARLDEQGDGLRSFVATLGSAKSASGKVLLIDEPEAFLHPPQAFQVGRIFGEESFDGKQIVCATHSADFLRGILAGGRDVTVVRLSRDRTQKVSVLSPDDLRKIAKDPVLSSVRILDGIFYQNVIITESDGDAVLYSAVSNRNGIVGETYYVNSYGKGATASVAEPYRKMGVPVAAIVDLDLIRVVAEFRRVSHLFIEISGETDTLVTGITGDLQSKKSPITIETILQEVECLRENLKILDLDDSDKKKSGCEHD